jgi:hypothetical protein
MVRPGTRDPLPQRITPMLGTKPSCAARITANGARRDARAMTITIRNADKRNQRTRIHGGDAQNNAGPRLD